MAKCKLCKKVINDGTEFCTDCTDKKDLFANESYLDDLLNSVQGKATNTSDIYKRKKDNQSSESSVSLVPPIKDEAFSYNLEDLTDLSDFEQFDIIKDLDDPIVISNEELYGDLVDTDNEISNGQYENEEGNDNTMSPNIEEYTGDIGLENNIDNEFFEMDVANIHNVSEDEYIEPALDDLMKQLELSSDDYDNISVTNTVEESADIFKDIEEDSIREETSLDEALLQDKGNTAENDLLDLLNQFDPENPIEDDIQAISDLLGGLSTDNIKEKEYPEDVGEVFSEALEAVSDLDDPDNGIKYLLQEPEAKKIKKGPKEKKKKDKSEGLFSKLFANIDDDDLEPEKKKARDEAAVAKVAKKKKKRTKDNKEQNTDQEGTEEAPARGSKEAETKKDKKKEKKVKKDKEKKLEILDEEVDEGRINRVGASLVFAFFGILVMLLLVSTNIFSYSLSINNATDYFGRQRYTQAYNEVYGIDIKDEDIELYDKIMTVMYVNKQLNSYNNYYHMRKFPEALDSLLKGLQRYDKYIELATMLGIKTDLDYVRNQIIAELYNVFSLTEEQAVNIINSESQAKYSIAVYDVVLENITYYN